MIDRPSYLLRLSVVMLVMLALLSDAVAQTRELPAFPGAEGFGAFTVGGRGGEVYRVTTLADYAEDELPIEGSMRAAIEAQGPRTVVFRVAGYIELKRPLEIRHPYLTIAAQTAPGEGVALKNYSVEINASEVTVRYLRVRPGDVAGEEQDAINVRARNVIVDHCSVSWGTDETISVVGAATDVTIQWCLIAESLNHSVHHKGAHGYGTLLTAPGDVSIHHSAYLFHHSRNPRPKDLLLDFRNNLIYGFGERAGYNLEDFTRMNYVGNVVVPLDYSQLRYAFTLGGTNGRVFAEDNILHDTEGIVRDWSLFRPPDGVTPEETERLVRVAVPFAAPWGAMDTPEDAFRRILDEAGATRPARDAVDRRVVALVHAGDGRIIDSQNEVGGWPVLESASPPPDADADGMADDWEIMHGLDPDDGTDHAADLDDDGYTNLEEYLNATDPAEPFAWVPPPVIAPAHGSAFTDSVLTVTITPNNPDDPVYVTLDGTEPTLASLRYHAPLHLTGSTHLRARTIHQDAATTTAYAALEKLTWQPAADDLPPDLVPGLRFAYYEAADWDEGPPAEALTPVHTGVAAAPDFDLRQRNHDYALVFDGYLDVPRDGIYTFTLHDDARSRLYLDGTLVAHGNVPGSLPGRVALRVGKHRFLLRSLREEPGPPASLRWEGPEFETQSMPPAAFSWNPADV